MTNHHELDEGDDVRQTATSAPQLDEQVLRLLFAIALDHETAATCLGADKDRAVSLWPSTLYQILAATALRSPWVWQQCQRAVDSALDWPSYPHKHRAPVEVATAFSEGREVCSGVELARALWSLIRHRQGATNSIVQRLAAELETIAAQRLGKLPATATRAEAKPVRSSYRHSNRTTERVSIRR